MDAATIATQVVGLSLVAGVISQFTKDRISTDSRVRTVWALAVSATVAILGVAVSGLLAWLSGDDMSGRALVTALVVQIPAVIGGAQAIYAAVHAIVPGSKDVDIDKAVAAVKELAATAEQVVSDKAADDKAVTVDKPSEE
jgi:cytochrome bd-type quinol oxidase subunit 2